MTNSNARYTNLRTIGASCFDQGMKLAQAKAYAIAMGIVKHDDMMGVSAVIEGWQNERARMIGTV